MRRHLVVHPAHGARAAGWSLTDTWTTAGSRPAARQLGGVDDAAGSCRARRRAPRRRSSTAPRSASGSAVIAERAHLGHGHPAGGAAAPGRAPARAISGAMFHGRISTSVGAACRPGPGGATTGTRVPGRNRPCFSRAAVGDGTMMSAADAGGVEEGVALGGGAVARHPAAVGCAAASSQRAQPGDRRRGCGRANSAQVCGDEQPAAQLALDRAGHRARRGGASPARTIV